MNGKVLSFFNNLLNIENFMIKLGLRKPKSTGIKVENSRGVRMEKNDIRGFETGVEVKRSEDVGTRENRIVR